MRDFMKTLSKILGVAALASTLVACGSNAPVNPALVNNGYGPGVNGVGVGPGGCVPIQSGALSFTAQGAAMNTAVLLAGNLPMNSTHPGQYGQVVMGGGIVNSGYGMIQYQPKQSQNGTIQLSASYAQGSMSTVSGVIQLNQNVIQQIYATMGYYGGMNTMQYPNNNMYMNNVCVSSLALDVVQTILLNNNNYYYGTGMQQNFNQPGTGQVNQALVYLYLSSGQPVGPIVF